MRCCGCGTDFADVAGPTHRYMLSSPGCWAAYGEVLARAYQDPLYFSIHRLMVDAYAAHHPGVDSPPARNSVGIHLSRLCLWFDAGWDLKQIDGAMGAMSGKVRAYPWLTPPLTRTALSVADVRAATNPDKHRERVEQWARAVWENWRDQHATVREWNAGLRLEGISKS
jgi:hypothetical protein